MAYNSKDAKKQAQLYRDNLTRNYLDRFEILFHNSVELENNITTNTPLPKRYLLTQLFEKGAIAYDKETGLFLPFTQMGIDIYGLPQQYQLIGFNGYTVLRKAEDVVILRANDKQIPLKRYVDLQISKIVDIDIAIAMNLESTKTMTLVGVADESTLLTMINQMDNRRVGASVCFVNKSATLGNDVTVQSTGATYLVDKLLEARKEILNETYSTIGISVSNTDKKERVQSIEVQASQGYALDSINAMIDTFNYDAEFGGIDIRLKGNTSLIDDKELEKEQTNNENITFGG